MTVDYKAIQDELVSVAQRSGYFEKIEAHEPKNAPGKGLSCFVFAARLRPIRAGGLNSTSALLVWTMQIRCDMLREPQDSIDIDCLLAADSLIAALSGNFKLDVTGVRGVDLLGAYSDGLGADSGYLDHGGVLYRIYDVMVPIIINNAWSQAA